VGCIWATEKGSNGRLKEIHNEQLHDLYENYFTDQFKKKEMGGTCGTYAGRRESIQDFRWEA